MLALPILKTSAKSVQTTAEVSKKYYVLTNLSTRTYENKYTYLQKYLRVLTETSTSYSLKRVRRIYQGKRIKITK